MTLEGMAKPHRAIHINLTFVDKDLKVFDQMQMTIAAPPYDAGWRARPCDGKASDTNTLMSMGVSSPRPAGWCTVEGDPLNMVLEF